MRVIEKIIDLKAAILSQKNLRKTIGFVPTMGYLHEGHVSLIRASKAENDFTVMSIFVNPTQFGVNEDLDKYPRDLNRDSLIAENAGVDIIFAPSREEIYPNGYKTFVNVDSITEVLCGKTRHGHFKGVTTIVNKLFNIIEPDKAYFGQKDAQQSIVIKKMVKDLNMNVEVEICPIIREKDGLAMSSRNIYLNFDERKAALVLSKSLFKAEALIKAGETNKDRIIAFIRNSIFAEKLASIDYIEALDADNLEDIEEINKNVLIALAVKFGTTRLIDNVIVRL